MAERKISHQMEALQWLEEEPIPVFVYQMNPVGEIVYANRKFLELFACSSWEEFLFYKGATIRDVIHKDDIRRVVAELRQQQTNNPHGINRGQYRIVTREGKIVYIEDFGKANVDPVLGPLIYVYMFQSTFQFSGYGLDQHTNLPGEQRFLKYLEKQMEKHFEEAHQDVPLSVIYYNIRNFRLYNASHGEEAGDILLYELASVLVESFGEAYIARFTDDRFVVLTENADVQQSVDEVNRRFMDKYDAYKLELKAGIYQILDNQKSAHAIVDLAKASCDSIRFERAYSRIYDAELEKQIMFHSYIPQMFDMALEKKWIKIYYQPIIRTETGKLCGLEALARWEDPIHGCLSPVDFITILEENRMIHRLDLFMLEEHCRMLRSTSDKGHSVIPTSFNLSRSDFVSCDIFREVETIRKKYQIEPYMINLEITESTLIDGPKVLQAVNQFRAAGYEVWMDDFGSGYSTLNILKDAHFDEVKLDMEFLRNLNDISKQIIKSVVDMAKTIGIHTLAEGVETQEQMEFLRSIGCEKVQGYLFGKPDTLQNTVRHCLAKGMDLEERKYLDAGDF